MVRIEPRAWLLFGTAVLIWGTTWHAITYQIDALANTWSVAARFALAALTCGAVARFRGEPLRLPMRLAARAGLQGAFMYSLSYLCVYEAERHIPSGLVAVGYSLAPMINGAVSHALWHTPWTRRFAWGSVWGVLGVALIFAPEWSQPQNSQATLWGSACTLAAVALSSVGSLWASRNHHHGMPLWSSLAWGMAAGALLSAVLGAILHPWPQWPTHTGWWVSLAYLAMAGSAAAFACYLTLQRWWGPGPAGTVGVATPVIALTVSTALEGFEPGWATVLGAALALLGNAACLGLIPWRRGADSAASKP